MGICRCKIAMPQRVGLVLVVVITLLVGLEAFSGQSVAVNDHLSTPKHFARVMYLRQGGTVEQWQCLATLWTMESHWNFQARNTNGGAFGIPQALPASKMLAIGKDYRYNWQTQIRWGLLYLKHHWSNSACNALRHEYQKGWY